MTPTPRRLRLPFAVSAAAALLVGAVLAPASGADSVTTKDGLVLEGRTVRAADGSVTVSTKEGPVTIPADRLAGVEAGEGPRATLAAESSKLAAGDALGHYRLALQAES